MLYSPALTATSGGEHDCKTTLYTSNSAVPGHALGLMFGVLFLWWRVLLLEGQFPPGITRIDYKKG
jgi:hypothetical protein